jgi:phosphatidate cytidylyltransferase
MNKNIIGLVLAIILFIVIKCDLLQLCFSFVIIGGLYELIKNFMEYKNKHISILFGIIILIISGDLVANNKINSKDILFILLIVIISDIAQEITGKYFGKNKIGWISPNKTIEGYIGGYIGILIYYFITNKNIKDVKYFSFLTSIYLLGISGDLFFSYIKRIFAIKDYSEILMSHGGILDRFDSFIFAIFGYALYQQCNKIKNG